MEIGKLDRLVSIYSASYADDAYGDGNTITWTLYKSNIWMGFGAVNKSGETHEARQKVDVQSNLWKARYDSGINVEMKIAYNSQNYYIVNVREIGRKQGLELTTELRDNE